MLTEKTNFAITPMVRLLEASRPDYYAWIDRKPSDRAIRRETIEQKMAWFHGDSDEADLHADGETISRKTVATTMTRLGLAWGNWKTTTVVDHDDANPVDAEKRQ